MAKIQIDDWLDQQLGMEEPSNKARRLRQLVQYGYMYEAEQKVKAALNLKREDAVHQIQSGSSVTRFVNLMLSGECTQPLTTYGQLYGGLGWAE
jgi:hypothetical protein